MNFGEIISLVHNATEADNMLGVIPRMVNSAIRDIARQRSFTWMADTIVLSINPGESTTPLPERFKEPQRGVNALRAIDNSTEGFEPWKLVSKQELLKLQKIGTNVADSKACIEEIAEGTLQLRIAGAAGVGDTPLSFQLDCYMYPADLVSRTDTNRFTTEAEQAVIQRAIYLVNSLMRGRQKEMAQAAGLYKLEFDGAAAEDGARRVAGRAFRMGGI